MVFCFKNSLSVSGICFLFQEPFFIFFPFFNEIFFLSHEVYNTMK